MATSYAKYIGTDSPESFGPGPDECPEAQATAYDALDNACYRIFGVGITIADLAASYQGGFEVCNFNFHMRNTRPAVPVLAGLEGPVLV